MKHLKRFLESDNTLPEINFEESKRWIQENYPDTRVMEMFDGEVSSGNWIDNDQMEDEGYESEHDYYTDYGRGEAESAVVDDIFLDLKSKFDIKFDLTNDDTDLYQFMKDEYSCLSNL